MGATASYSLEGLVATALFVAANHRWPSSIIIYHSHSAIFAQFNIISDHCHPVSCYLNSNKLFLIWAINIITLREIQAWDLSVCLLNLYQGDFPFLFVSVCVCEREREREREIWPWPKIVSHKYKLKRNDSHPCIITVFKNQDKQ